MSSMSQLPWVLIVNDLVSTGILFQKSASWRGFLSAVTFHPSFLSPSVRLSLKFPLMITLSGFETSRYSEISSYPQWLLKGNATSARRADLINAPFSMERPLITATFFLLRFSTTAESL